MNKKIISVFVVLVIICTLVGCGQSKHQHTWVEATCTEPKHCSECGETEGSILGHDWISATCETPMTCARCGQTSGDTTGHTVVDGEIIKEATCTEEGQMKGICSVCQKEVTVSIPMTEHVAGDWEIITPATYNTWGERAQKCVICGAELNTETYSLSAEEKEASYKSSCEWISYTDLARRPDDYKGRLVTFTGKVVQVMEDTFTTVYRINVTQAYYGLWDDTVYVTFSGSASGGRVLEDDIVTFYGKYNGLKTYETIFGGSVTIPYVIADYIDIN